MSQTYTLFSDKNIKNEFHKGDDLFMIIKFKLVFLILICGLISTSCALQRHSDSGYSSTRPIHFKRTPRTPSLGTDVSLNDSQRLKRLESNLQSQQEIKQYYKYKPLLKTDQKRISFLQQQGVFNRNLWVEKYLFPKEKKTFSSKEIKMIANRDITIGMSQNAVIESWGKPTEKRVAGQSLRGNELWVYKKLVPTSNGYKTEFRHIFFETGHVAGWETK